MSGIELGRQPLLASGRVAFRSWREVWLKIHLWLGLALGLFLSAIGITGSALVFFHEIDELLNPTLLIVDAPADGLIARRPLEEIAAAARKAISREPTASFVYYPNHGRKAFWFFYIVEQTDDLPPDVLNVFVDPYTAKVTGTRMHYSGRNPFANSLTGFLFKLHYSLLLRDTGSTIVGIMAVLALFSTATGVVLWWPRNGRWRNAFSMKWPAKRERLNYDIHRLSGIFLLPVALAVIVSGVYFNLPRQFNAIVELFSPLTKVERSSSSPEGDRRVTLDEAFAVAVETFPDSRTESFSIDYRGGPYVFNQMFPIGGGVEGRRTIYVDRRTGGVLHVNDPLAGDGDGLIQWQWPLHSGHVYGWPGRFAVFLFGLSWPLVFVTGIIRWRQKARARKVARERRS